jgi:hypothetical protein
MAGKERVRAEGGERSDDRRPGGHGARPGGRQRRAEREDGRRRPEPQEADADRQVDRDRVEAEGEDARCSTSSMSTAADSTRSPASMRKTSAPAAGGSSSGPRVSGQSCSEDETEPQSAR